MEEVRLGLKRIWIECWVSENNSEEQYSYNKERERERSQSGILT